MGQPKPTAQPKPWDIVGSELPQVRAPMPAAPIAEEIQLGEPSQPFPDQSGLHWGQVGNLPWQSPAGPPVAPTAWWKKALPFAMSPLPGGLLAAYGLPAAAERVLGSPEAPAQEEGGGADPDAAADQQGKGGGAGRGIAGTGVPMTVGRGETTYVYGPPQAPGYADAMMGTLKPVGKARRELEEQRTAGYTGQALRERFAIEDIEKQHKKIADEREALMQSRARYQQMFDNAMQSAQLEEPNPERWWQNRTTGQRVALLMASAIMDRGTFMGALGAIQGAINTDVKTQLAAIQNRRGQRQEMLNMVDRIDARINNLPAAAKMYESMLWGQVLRQREWLSTRLKTPEEQLASQQDQSILKQKQLSVLNEAYQATQPEKRIEKRGWRQISGGGRAAGGGAPGMPPPGSPTDVGGKKEDKTATRNMVSEIGKMREHGDMLESYIDDFLKVGSQGGRAGEWAGKATLGLFGFKGGAVATTREFLTGKEVKTLYGGHASDRDRESIKRMPPQYGDNKAAIIHKYKTGQDVKIAYALKAADRWRRVGHTRRAAWFLEEARQLRVQKGQTIKKIQQATDFWFGK